MTIAELIEELQRYDDDSRLVCVDTLGFSRGIYPIADTTQPYTVTVLESYDTVVLQPSAWPTGDSE